MMPSTARVFAYFIHRLITPSLAFVAAAAIPDTASASGELECVQRAPVQVWSDSGSGGSKDGAIWRPRSGYSLGDTVVDNYQEHPELCGFVDVAPEGGAPALAEATAYIWRYDDSGTGAHRDVSVWEPLCTPGYVALGMVAAPSKLKELKCPRDEACYEFPLYEEFQRFRCVREDLVRKESGSPTLVWNDKKTGGKHDVSFWHVGRVGLDTPAFFWVHRSHATPTTAMMTTGRSRLKPGVVTLPQPVAAIDEVNYFNIRVMGSRYVAVDVAGAGANYITTTNGADPRAQFRFIARGDAFEIVNRSTGAAIGSEGMKKYLAEVASFPSPGTSTTWRLEPAKGRAFVIRPQGGGAADAIGMTDKLVLRDRTTLLVEFMKALEVDVPGGDDAGWSPGLGDDRALRLGLELGAGLVGAATKGMGSGLVNLIGIFALGNPSAGLERALTELYNRVQVDIGQGIAANKLTEAGNAMLDATYELVEVYPYSLRDNIDDPNRHMALQLQAKDTANGFREVRRALSLERSGGQIIANPTNASVMDAALPLIASAATSHVVALQEAAMISAYDSVGAYDDELATLASETEAWISLYEEIFGRLIDWRKSSVQVTEKIKWHKKGQPPIYRYSVKLTEKPSWTSTVQTVGERTAETELTKIPAGHDTKLRDRYRVELDFGHNLRYRPAEFAANLRAVKDATAALCAKIRTEGSPERAAYLARAKAGPVTVAAAKGMSKSQVSAAMKAAMSAKASATPRRKLKQVKGANGRILWTVE